MAIEKNGFEYSESTSTTTQSSETCPSFVESLQANVPLPDADFNPYGPKTPLTSWRKALVFLGISTCIFLQALDQTISATTLAAVTKDFNNFKDVSWIGTSYLLTSTAFLPLYGAASDMFGRKRVVIAATIFFLLGSGLAGAAQSMIMLIIGRAVQGLGGGGIGAMTKTLVSDIVPRREVSKYQGFIAFTYTVASTFGPLVGGVLSDGANWRWAYYINFPIGTVSMLLLIVFLHVRRPKTFTLRQRLAMVDYPGIVLIVVSVVMVLLALSWTTTNRYAWDSSVVLCLLTLGVVAGLGFLLNEWKVAKHPLIPLRLFSTTSLAANQLCIFICGMAYLSYLFTLPLYYQAVHGATAVESGVVILLLAVLCSVSVFAAGFLMSKINSSKECVVAGLFLGTIASGLLTTLAEQSSRAVVIGILVLLGVSTGLNINSSLLNIYSELNNYQDVAMATSLWSFLRACGGTMGIAVASASIQSSLSAAGAAEYANNIQAIHGLPPEVQAPIVRAFVTGMHRYFIVVGVLYGIALLAATLFIQKLPLSRGEPEQQEPDPCAA